MDVHELLHWHDQYKCAAVAGRYLPASSIVPVLNELPAVFRQWEAGKSTQGRPIRAVEVGKGSLKILCWSQMHGNESTGTKAVLDLFNWLQSEAKEAELLLEKCTLVFLPIINPDGAEVYTRVNAQEIDLNRDVIDLKAPESRILQTVLKQVNPEYCFNLHDQRTIFSVGDDPQPATLSFLAPSIDLERTVTEGRQKTMAVIAAMFNALDPILPGQIGRYNDAFYPTATGDNFEKMGHHTILIEAGHYRDDYAREVVRKYNWLALVLGLLSIAEVSPKVPYKRYFEIPENEEKFLDEIHRQVYLTALQKEQDLGILYKERLVDGQIVFNPQIEKVGDLTPYRANKCLDPVNKSYKNENDFLENYRK